MHTILQRLCALRNNIEYFCGDPIVLQEALLTIPTLEKIFLLNLLDAIRDLDILNKLPAITLVDLIKDIFRLNFLLPVKIVALLQPRTRHQVAALLSNDTRNEILEALHIWQKSNELEFMLDGEYIPDCHIVTDKWPDLFPERLRRECSICKRDYVPFDVVEVAEDVQSSFHEHKMCNAGLFLETPIWEKDTEIYKKAKAEIEKKAKAMQ